MFKGASMEGLSMKTVVRNGNSTVFPLKFQLLWYLFSVGIAVTSFIGKKLYLHSSTFDPMKLTL
jgi:hypothetical protein